MIRPNLLIDSHGRIMRDLRVSVTDRCNFRCLYCLPETEAALNFYRGRWANLPNPAPIARQWKSAEKILSFEEIERLVRLAAEMGIQKIRLTGGEPLLRRRNRSPRRKDRAHSWHQRSGDDDEWISLCAKGESACGRQD